MIVFIDSGVLGLLTNPKKQGKPSQCEDLALFPFG